MPHLSAAVPLSFLAACSAAAPAWADLMLYPTRVVLESRQRAAEVQLVNRGTSPATYRISLVNRRMTDSGEIVEAKDAQPGEAFADELLRYSPRQVTLQPGVAQTVRIAVRKPAGLPAGEYRSHMQFDRVPDAAGQSNLEAVAQPEQGQIAISIQALIGASIPVIVREGSTNAEVALEQLRIQPADKPDAPPLLAFDIRRSGNRSVYGDLVATFTPAGGAPLEVAKVAGVAVYVPNAQRQARLPLALPAGVALQRGTLRLQYNERPDAGGKLLAAAELALP